MLKKVQGKPGKPGRRKRKGKLSWKGHKTRRGGMSFKEKPDSPDFFIF